MAHKHVLFLNPVCPTMTQPTSLWDKRAGPIILRGDFLSSYKNEVVNSSSARQVGKRLPIFKRCIGFSTLVAKGMDVQKACLS